ncbi:hypothetical protein Tco_0958228 [Tanacetum coccineum]
MLPSLPQKKLDLIDSNFLFTEIGIGKREKKYVPRAPRTEEMKVVLLPMDRREAFHLVRRLENSIIRDANTEQVGFMIVNFETGDKVEAIKNGGQAAMLLLDHAPMNKASSAKNKNALIRIEAPRPENGDNGDPFDPVNNFFIETHECITLKEEVPRNSIESLLKINFKHHEFILFAFTPLDHFVNHQRAIKNLPLFNEARFGPG